MSTKRPKPDLPRQQTDRLEFSCPIRRLASHGIPSRGEAIEAPRAGGRLGHLTGMRAVGQWSAPNGAPSTLTSATGSDFTRIVLKWVYPLSSSPNPPFGAI